ncbi:Gfo/Idh/MocA family oxidoreductase [Enterococcus mundtii]|nr:Gfo/Idh/MocA family oxidoreductase [Enterococcus mundtii]
MKQLVMAIVGYGKSAKRYHLPYINVRETIKVKYICDLHLSQDDITELGKSNIIGVTDLSTVLEDDEVIVITLCTPPETHFSLAKECLEARKNVIIEKPFCETLAQAETLLQLAKEQNVHVIPYQNRRFDSDFLTLKKVIERNYLGTLIELEAHIDYYRPNTKERKGTILDGSFYGLGVHAVDQIVSIFGKPNRVQYDLRSVQNDESTVDDYYDVQLIYGVFKVILKSSQVVAKSGPRFRLLGTMGAYEKYGSDQQENDLKAGVFPGEGGFGMDTANEYGIVTYRNANGDWIEKAITSEMGDYGCFYDGIIEMLFHNAPSIVSEEEIQITMEIMDGASFG